MTSAPDRVERHYGRGAILESILGALSRMGNLGEGRIVVIQAVAETMG